METTRKGDGVSPQHAAPRSAAEREPSLAELTAEAQHAADRLALYHQRLYAGKGDLRRLAELERTAAGAAERLNARRQAAR
jgi:hypothetical protein